MTFNITFLGTSSMVPTKDRNHSSIYIEYLGEGLLVDCGEGTQRQLRIAGIRHSKIKRIFITHWHGDHTLGIPGLIQTMGNSDYSGKLEIYGPAGTKTHMENIMKAFVFDCRVEFEAFEIKEDGKFLNIKNYIVEAYKLEHNTPSLGYRFVEKDKRKIDTQFVKNKKIPNGPLLGKLQNGSSIEWKGEKITPSMATKTVKGKILGIMLDTSLCANSGNIAQNANLFISEATFSSHLKDRAENSMHMTAEETANLAKSSKVKTLVLTHLSQRYKEPDVILNEAKEIFDKTIIAEDFMKIKV